MKRRKTVSKQSKKLKTAKVRFECKPERASTVFLAGAFNDWSKSATPMKCDKKRIWSATVDLPPGRYEYKFIIDGEWCCNPELLPDPSHVSCVPNTFGTMNFAIEVGVDK